MVTTNVKQQALKCAEGMVRQPVLEGMCGRLIVRNSMSFLQLTFPELPVEEVMLASVDRMDL